MRGLTDEECEGYLTEWPCRMSGPGGIGVNFLRRGQLKSRIHDKRNSYRWLYLLQGEARCTDEHGRVHELGPGDCFIRAPNMPHTVERSASLHYRECALVLPTLQWKALCALGIINPQQRFAKIGLDAQRLDFLFQWANILQNQNTSAQISQSLSGLHEILSYLRRAELSPAQQQRQQQAESLRALIDQHIASSVSLEYIAKEIKLSQDTCRRLFNEFYGMLPKEYRIHKRCEKAAELLLNDRRSIASVAEELGYPDAYSFSKQFRKVFGESPSAYRTM